MTLDPSAVGALYALSWRGWVVHRGVARSGVRRGDIDHVLVGPGGVFVVARLPSEGEVDVRPGQLRVGGRSRTEEVDDVAADAVDVLGIVPDVPVHAVLCLEQHEPVTGWVNNVMICATSTVEQLVTSRPPVLSPERVQEVGLVLAAHLRRRPTPPPGARSNGSRRSVTERALLGVAGLAVATLAVASVLQSGVGEQIASAMSEAVADEPQPPEPQPRPETPPVAPSAEPSQEVEEGPTIEVKGVQCRVDGKVGGKKDRSDRDGDGRKSRCPGEGPRQRDRERQEPGRPRG